MNTDGLTSFVVSPIDDAIDRYARRCILLGYNIVGIKKSLIQLKYKTMTPTDEVNKRFPRGTKVSGVVRSICYFGYFVEIPGIEIRGLVETVGFFEFERENIPKIGSKIEAVILQFRDSKKPSNRQFRLTTHPNALGNSEKIKPLKEIGYENG